MHLVDWAVFVTFLAWVVYDGVRRSRSVQTLEHYFAGGRSIPWWAAGLSIMATQASAITIVGTTGQGYADGMEFVQFYFALPFAMIVLCVFMVPMLRRLPILTAYEYLEHRFGPATRALASLIFLLSRSLAVGAVIFAPATVMSQVLHVDLVVMILCVGGLTTLYTMLGGVSAVIWTDVKQMSVILGGLVLCVGVLLYHLLPDFTVPEMLRLMGAADKLNAVEVVPASTELVPRWQWQTDGKPSFWEDKYNLWSGLIGSLFLFLAYFGCDQSQVQRILTNPSVRESRQSLLVSAVVKLPMQTVVLLIGALMFLLFTMHETPPLFKEEHQRAVAGTPEYAQVEQRYRSAEVARRDAARELARAAEPERDEALARYRAAVEAEAVVRKEALHLVARTQKAQADAEAAAAAARDVTPLVAGGDDDTAGPVQTAAPVEPADDTNFIFTWFMLRYLPPVALGLIMAAIIAAAMSSIDSALNSLSSAFVVDFWRRWLAHGENERTAVGVSRSTTLVLGVISTFFALFYVGAGPIIETINKVGSYFYGSLLGVFALAWSCPRAGARAGFVGLMGGMALVVVVHFTLRIEFLGYNVVGCVGVLAAGWLTSWFDRRTSVPPSASAPVGAPAAPAPGVRPGR